MATKDDGSETVHCQLDSGLTCEVMTLRQCTRILQNGAPTLYPSSCRLRFYDGSMVVPIGICRFVCKHKDQEVMLSFQIIDIDDERDSSPLLSARACEWLQLITRNFAVAKDPVKSRTPLSKDDLLQQFLLQQFPSVFHGLGRLPGKYKLQTNPEIRPIQHAPRKIPVPLQKPVRTKLDEPEAKGVSEGNNANSVD